VSSIQKRPNGSWRARYRDDAGREHSRHFPRKVDAQRYLDGVTTSIRSGTYVDPATAKTTLRAFYADWSTRQVWAATTAVSMDLVIGRCSFGDVEFSKLRRSHVEAWVKEMSVAGLAPTTIRTRVNNVRSVLKAAHRDRLLMHDPTDGVTLPRRRKLEHAMTIPTSEQVGAILEAADDWFRPFVALCAFAGLRLGESTAVQVGDVDFLRRRLAVRRQVQRGEGRGGVAVVPPKYGSEREVFVPDELLQMLAQHVERVGVRGDEGWLFGGPGTGPRHTNTMAYWWGKTVKAAGVEGVTPHDLRHYFASGLIAAGCSVATVQRALGHASPSVTLNTYTHLWPTAEDHTRRASGELMRTALGAPADSLRTRQA